MSTIPNFFEFLNSFHSESHHAYFSSNLFHLERDVNFNLIHSILSIPPNFKIHFFPVTHAYFQVLFNPENDAYFPSFHSELKGLFTMILWLCNCFHKTVVKISCTWCFIYTCNLKLNLKS